MARNTADDFRPSSDSELPLFAVPALRAPRDPQARASDPPVCHEAARGAKRFAGGQFRDILDALSRGPGSKTQLADRTGIKDVAVARRISDLIDAGLVVVVSQDGRSATGHRERVYGLAAPTTERGVR
jgi:predicted transcriptional regulator